MAWHRGLRREIEEIFSRLEGCFDRLRFEMTTTFYAPGEYTTEHRREVAINTHANRTEEQKALTRQRLLEVRERTRASRGIIATDGRRTA